MAAGWFYSPSQIVRYFATRASSLSPPKVCRSLCDALTDHPLTSSNSQNKLRNPIAILRELTLHQWLMFSVGFMAWTWDAFDFFTVSLCITEISADFGVSYAAVSWVRSSRTAPSRCLPCRH